MLVTDTPPGTLEPLAHQSAAGGRSQSDDHQRADDGATGGAVLRSGTLRREPRRPVRHRGAALAAVGLYGVTAYTVAQRTNEIGIRMALGADRGKVIDLVLRGAFKRVVVGLILGLPLAMGAGRLIAAQLYGVSFWDPLALAVAAGSLAVCAFFAAIIPATRAASISPMTALRTE